MTVNRFDHSNRLYQRALNTIPLASQTFSKSAMMYVRGASPLFMERGEGAWVWDPDDNRYVDFVLGLMPVVLGYRDPDVDAAIRAQLDKGIVFSLPSELEMVLAERLVRLIPCAEMVRFGKNGSDATSAAIRLARAHTGRDRVAVAGYHGWHDWYIGSTARHLGVPGAVRELTDTFSYNDADSLEKLLKTSPEAYAAVILEPAGVAAPEPGYLERIRELTEKYGVVLVFDEIVTGFRIDMGGAQAKYGVTPDLATFGKAMANGMPISAIVGKREIMRFMEDIFFSGTFGGEALSLAASIATLDKLERVEAPEQFAQFGNRIFSELGAVIEKSGVQEVVGLQGVEWWPRFAVKGVDGVEPTMVTSLLRQELVANGVLMGGGFNLSYAHCSDPEVLGHTLHGIEQALGTLQSHLNTDAPEKQLLGEPIQPVFQVRK